MSNGGAGSVYDNDNDNDDNDNEYSYTCDKRKKPGSLASNLHTVQQHK